MEENFENKTQININKIKNPDDRSSGTLLSIGNNSFLLIGGANREKTFDDFWLLKINKQLKAKDYEVQWSEVKFNSAIPSSMFQPRFGANGAFVNSKSSNTLNDEINILLHGGQNYFENKHFADLLEISLKKEKEFILVNSITNITNYPLNPETTPRERNSHSMNYFDNKLFTFGGGSNEGLRNDLWSFDLGNYKWTHQQIKGVSIPPREMHGSKIFTNKQNESSMYIFGGRLYEEIDNKIYKINLNSLTCEVYGELPTKLCSFSYAQHKHFLIIYGGTDGVSFINDIVVLNIISNRWAKSKVQINSDFINNDENMMGFLGRIGSMMSIDKENEALVIFGGSSLHKDNNYTFVININELLDENNLIPI